MSGAGVKNDAGPLIEARELSVRLYGGRLAVDRVSFTIAPGERAALVGESGCGKTLTALSLLRAIPPEVGATEAARLELDGEDLMRMPRSMMRRVRGGRISMIFQDPMAALNPLFTVGDQMREAIRSHRTVDSLKALEQASRHLAGAGLSDTDRILRSYPHQLSGGQCQRVLIAMALSTDPDLLIADEPTTALDVTVQRRILDLLRGLSRSRNLSLLLITHNLAVVAHLADRVLMMYAGQIVESAPAEDIFRAPAHPYTAALLECMPSVRLRREVPPTIAGNVPQPGQWPEGCRFRPRCPHAVAGCGEFQELEPFRGRHDRLVRCWRAAGLAREAEHDGQGRSV